MIYKIAEIIATVIDCIFLLWYVPTFLSTRFYERKNLIKLIVPAICLVFELTSDVFLPGFQYLVMVVLTILSLLYALLVCEKKYFRAVFATSSYIITLMFTGSLVFVIMSSIIGDKAGMIQGAESTPRLIYLVICKLTEFAIYLIFLFLFGKTGDLNRKSSVFFSIYLFLTVSGLVTVTVISVNDSEGALNNPVLVITAVLTISLFFVYFFVHRLMDLQRKEYEYTFIKEKISTDKKILEESNAVLENISKIRHDMKNHFTIIKGMLEENNTESCIKYIDELYPKIDTIGDIVNSGHPVVDYLLNSKLSRRQDIHITISGSAGLIRFMEDLDIASLWGNLLDNAIEAMDKIPSEKEKRLDLFFITQKNSKIILCKNSINEPVLKNNGELKTTKREQGHGYGNRIVDSVVKKYGGFAEYSESGNMFCVQIVMP